MSDQNTPGTPGPTPPRPRSGPGDPSTEAIEADIERTRERLAETVDQLHSALDVKSRARYTARRTADRARDAVTTPDGRPSPAAASAAVVGVAVLVLVVLWRRRGHRR